MASEVGIEGKLQAPVTIEGEGQSAERTSVLLSLTSFAGGIIQGACAILVASSTAKIFLGVAGLAGALKTSEFHREAVRLPLMAVSTVLAIITLFVLWNGHRMRNFPSARWRKRTLTARERLGIGFSLVASVLTLVLVIAEISIHPLFGR